MRKPTEIQSKKLIDEDNQVQQELIDSSMGAYPKVDLHALRHVTDKKSPLYGRELLDPNPLQPASGIKPPPSLLSQMRDQIRLAQMAALEELHETEEEADDFDIADEPADPTTRWENDFEPSLRELRENRERIEQQLAAAEAAALASTTLQHTPRYPQGTMPPNVAAAPGATPPEKGVVPDSAAAPGGPPLPQGAPSAPTKGSFFGRGS